MNPGGEDRLETTGKNVGNFGQTIEDAFPIRLNSGWQKPARQNGGSLKARRKPQFSGAGSGEFHLDTLA